MRGVADALKEEKKMNSEAHATAIENGSKILNNIFYIILLFVSSTLFLILAMWTIQYDLAG